MTLETDIASVHFDHISVSEITPLTAMMRRCNSKLAEAQETLRDRGKQVISGDVTSFALDAIIEARATIRVYFDVATVITKLVEDRATEDEILSKLRDLSYTRAIMSYAINSSSNVSVEIDLAEKIAWGRFVEDLRWS